MMVNLNTSAFLIGILCIFIYASEKPWEPTNGPYGGCIRVLTASENKLYAGSNNGIGIFDKRSGHWEIAALPNTNSDTIVAISSQGATIIAAGAHSLYRSVNGGNFWTKDTVSFAGREFRSLLLCGRTAFAVNKKLFRSTDKGISWLPDSLGPECKQVTRLAFSRGTVLAGTDAGVFLSKDTGISWTHSKQDSQSNFCVLAFAVCDSVIIAGTLAGIQISKNNGISWTPSNAGLPKEEFAGESNKLPSIHALALCDGKLFANTGGDGMFCSNDKGTTWENCTSPSQAYILSLAGIGTTIYAGSDDFGIYQSNDGGISWTRDNSGLVFSDVLSLNVAGNLLCAGTQNGIYLSENNGVSWQLRYLGLRGSYVSSFCVCNNIFFVGSARGIYRSEDKGEWWREEPTPEPNQPSITHGCISSLTVFDGKIYAGSNYWGLLQSSNCGETWNLKEGVLSYSAVLCMISYGKTLVTGGINGVYFFDSNSVSDSGLSDPVSVRSLATSGTTLFAGTLNGVYRSNNRGTSWIADTLGLGKVTIDQIVALDTAIFVLYRNTIFRSNLSGRRWTLDTSGIGNRFITSLVARNGFIFAGTKGWGVWRKSL